MFGLKKDWSLDVLPRYFTLEDYEGGVARWCPGCGDHGVLAAVQRICRDEQLPPEKTIAVSGIGCSSRFPHYMHTYGFHGLHGRPLPVACGIKSRRPDLFVWVATGDGDCCSIGAGHWIHAVRYNMNMVVMLFDNNVYGLTKNQTSPTSKQGQVTNTSPRGAWLPPLNPTLTTLGMANVSFVAQTVDWNPVHVHATLLAAFHHPGFSFVRIFQRCPQYTSGVFEAAQRDPSLIQLVEHERGIQADPAGTKMYTTRIEHDPGDIEQARHIAHGENGCLSIGLLFQDPERPRYEDMTTQGLDMTTEEKVRALEAEFDRFAI
ncbi:MAG: 2-oxoglutarate oxidoreductase [Phycisphaerales bacterium]|nr:2-oxoglutarate oxidoreductase [Phycisphaerae bacterium]NNF43638.1 2-oxoglutarate oxidoreductase [Phycisphaerales bacterium]NNM25039.1 2-oxoglutarate oxidoreductase [Phycisphaerales bacterium]